jgi:PKD domain-containing protein
MAVQHALRPSGPRRYKSRQARRCSRSWIGVTLPLVAALLVLQTSSTSAYKVCTDDRAPCFHENMAEDATALYSGGGIAAHVANLRAGAGHEDNFDHVFGYEKAFPFSDSFVTASHFWDVDAGANDPVEFVDGYTAPLEWAIVGGGSYPNAYHKAQALWSLALGAYVEGHRDQAYELLGHVAHLVGDLTVPTHTHEDAHPPFDDDPFEEWMSGNGDGELFTHPLTNEERAELVKLGPLTIPDNVDKLYWLLNTTGQIADFFASMDVDGDAVDPNGWVQDELNQMTREITSPRVTDDLEDNDDGNNDDDGDLSRIRHYSFLRGIRATAALYKLFEESVAQRLTLTVVIDRVEEDEDHDFADDPDYWAHVHFGAHYGQNRGDYISDNNDIHPGWAFGETVGPTGQVTVRIEIWDWDGRTGPPDLYPGDSPDDQSDVDLEDDRTLELHVDLAKCLRREEGAVTGLPNPAACGAPLVSESNAEDEASKLYFHIYTSNAAPTAEAGGPYTTDEGANVRLDGSRSSDPNNDIVSHTWDLDGDGACDDATGPTPDFAQVGQDGVFTVKLCVTDATGLTGEDTATVTVRNVAPRFGLTSPAPVAENTTLSLGGTITDPGWLDPLTATVSWGDGSAAAPLSGTLENVRPDATFTYSATHTYGDNGTFTVQVCAADDDTNPCATAVVTVDNTKPSITIDLGGAITVNGTATVIAHAGTAVAFDGRVTDPGSDDLTLLWTWGDGTPPSTRTSLVNPPNADPAVSPSVQPRDLRYPQSHTFGKACTFESSLTATDDDTGVTAATVNVIIVGNNHPNQLHGYWKQQFRSYVLGLGPSDFDAATLTCYLKIASYMSRVFTERTAAQTFTEAYAVLDTGPTKPIRALFDVQLLAAWLNFANGSIEYNQLVDTNGDKRPDTPFLTAIAAAESIRLDPASTQQQLDQQKLIVEGWTKLP